MTNSDDRLLRIQREVSDETREAWRLADQRERRRRNVRRIEFAIVALLIVAWLRSLAT